MAFLADFTAIDFETANRRRDSACQLAAVVVRNGQIVREAMWMIRPDPFFFSPGNIRIHGIHPADVEDQPTFGDLWPEISQFLDGDCLIAHNAPFDIGVMIGCLQRHQHSIPSMNFSCTRLIAKQAWPDRQRYGLKPLATWLGVDFRHHDALEDSRACAKILLAAGIARQAESMEDLEQRLRIVRGKAGDWGVDHASRLGRPKSKSKSGKGKVAKGAPKRTLRRSQSRPLPLSLPVNPFDESSAAREHQSDYSLARTSASQSGQPSIDLQRVSIRAEFIQPLRGKQVLFCGRLNLLSNDQAIQLTSRSGGTPQHHPDDSTNCVVVGATDVDQAQIEALVKDREIQVLTESEFLGLVGA